MVARFVFLFFFLCSATLVGQDWQSSFEEAKKKAQEEEKPLLLVFSGSDWCAPCIKLERFIWQSEAFKEKAQSAYILYKADFPKKKKNQLPEALAAANKNLASTYNPEGYFPLVVIMDKNAKVQGTMGYERLNPSKYIKRIDAFLK